MWLFIKIFQRYQLNFTTLLCLKKPVSKSTLRKNIVIIVVAFSKDSCIIPEQIKFIHTDFLISVLA